ncbi:MULTISPECIES: hypothetical protein [unclassified Corynebacterium]|nr:MULTISPECIES: hypothetical protein [unclassified Corynebacterium]WPF67124.1 hypothetical protein OLX12_05275 [Corynebacterium sp. 22KM0430]WPF69612.1 hypothetical protein OLW90_05270 [Corynebacterium sp. 21KM1197]
MTPEELQGELHEALRQPAATLEAEADILERAHEILQGALKGKEG